MKSLQVLFTICIGLVSSREACPPPGTSCVDAIACGVKREYRQFSNMCQLETSGCRQGFLYLQQGKCNETSTGGTGSDQTTASPALTKEQALDSNGTCVIQGNFKDDCNNCICSPGGKPGCTKIACFNRSETQKCNNAPSCPETREPVCGIKEEYRTFGNPCQIPCAQGFQYVKLGDCPVAS